MAMVSSRRSPSIMGALTIISCLSLQQSVNGFLSTPGRKYTMVHKAIVDSDSEDFNVSPSSSAHNLSRRSAIAIGATAVLAPLTLATLPANASTESSIPSWKLDGGVEFPILALNTAGLSTEDTYTALEFAIDEGITHVDFHPGKERDGVAKYLSDHKDKRDLLFLNTKIGKPKPGTSPEDAKKLARDSPDIEVIQAQWSVLEEAMAAGKCRSIGVINYCQSELKGLLQTAKVVPAINYIMVHVGMGKDVHGLRTFGENAGIRTFSYGQQGEPVANPEILNSPLLKKIGKSHGKSTQEVSLKWVLQNGMAASVRPSLLFGLGVAKCEGKGCQVGIARQASCFNWSLTDKEMADLDAMTSPDDNPTLFSSAGCPGAFGMPK